MYFLIGNQHVMNPNDPNLTQASPGFAGQTRYVTTKDSSGNDDGGYKIQMCLYNGVGSALVKGQPYVVTPTSGTALGTGLQAQTAIALASVGRLVCVATAATPIGAWDWFDVAGDVDVLTDGSGAGIVIGDWLKLATGTSTVALVHDAANGQALETTASVAVACKANVLAATSIRVKLSGFPRVVNT